MHVVYAPEKLSCVLGEYLYQCFSCPGPIYFVELCRRTRYLADGSVRKCSLDSHQAWYEYSHPRRR